ATHLLVRPELAFGEVVERCLDRDTRQGRKVRDLDLEGLRVVGVANAEDVIDHGARGGSDGLVFLLQLARKLDLEAPFGRPELGPGLRSGEAREGETEEGGDGERGQQAST